MKKLMLVGLVGLGVFLGGCNSNEFINEEVQQREIKENAIIEMYMKDLKPIVIEGLDKEYSTDTKQVFNLSDGSCYVVDKVNKVYDFIPYDMGDYAYSFNNEEELIKCVVNYVEINNYEKKRIKGLIESL